MKSFYTAQVSGKTHGIIENQFVVGNHSYSQHFTLCASNSSEICSLLKPISLGETTDILFTKTTTEPDEALPWFASWKNQVKKQLTKTNFFIF